MQNLPLEIIVILDFGSQYSQLIARRIRENNVYCRILPCDVSIDEIRALSPKGIFLSGGPASVYNNGAPLCDPNIFKLGIPVFGVCYGMQLMAHLLGGKVEPAPTREYGLANLFVDTKNDIFYDLPDNFPVWMSHGDSVSEVPNGFEIIAHTDTLPIAVMADLSCKYFGTQFHPEVVHTPLGKNIIANFLFRVCKCNPIWTMSSFIQKSISEIKEQVKDDIVVCGVSGGVDSTVLAVLIHKAIGDQLKCIFVDNGLLRKNEADEVITFFRNDLCIDLYFVDANDRFLRELSGVVDPEQKRKIIGRVFVEVFQESASRFGDAKFLAQGTLYPDFIESGGLSKSPSATIKSHHNVGGLPEKMNLKLIEPLKELFKDEVRKLARELGLPEKVIKRHPFPGPGLAVRVIDSITREKLDLLRQADAIFIEELQSSGMYDKVWQAFAVLLPVRSVGVMGDERTYDQVIALRAVTAEDAMTADWAKLPYELLGKVSNRIINEVKGINRVVYDISSKPPSTIEWE
ncbi:MAG: glutamine-hydrolyzing GMP synthase [Candidatus Poribacteria bacterium]